LQRPGVAKAALFFIGFIFFGVAAANNDDGFVWLDANTKIKLVKPVSASAGETKAPPAKDKKAEKPKK
jgi:hypothetical protein